jgi:hypothetical protein
VVIATVIFHVLFSSTCLGLTCPSSILHHKLFHCIVLLGEALIKINEKLKVTINSHILVSEPATKQHELFDIPENGHVRLKHVLITRTGETKYDGKAITTQPFT